ncbi:uncharacterized protein LOC111652394 isoform X1 [Seriola lalandi dorsalis]|uniref:uncharacterized protein LOC111652394 isoform X1 n=1 Tax=Seriola lalandi dorsalis TaxID=1841481 RepID=UPI000C6F7118|nr:uncharacterized protein LOC111652394 isoform X1 [Seriola lalandi dorsalis]XP_056245127.1 stress-associated endoplasmic reticulum protein 2 isoform X1 [Seriola aureovittata]
MVAKQRIRMANEKHSKNITQRGNVAKTLPYFRSSRASAWGCDSEGASGPVSYPFMPSLSLASPCLHNPNSIQRPRD